MSNTKSREFLLIWDSTMSNPNGDMLNENRPRQDEITGQLEASDVRVKRFAREEWINKGEKVLVQTVEEKGKIQTCQKRVETIQKAAKIKDDDIEKYLTDNYIDVKLFGAVITKPKRDILGPLQVAWSKSVHEAQIKFMQGNAAYASSEGKSQASIWTKYISPYALFKTYAVYNNLVAKKQNINVEDKDIESFIEALIDGMKHYRSTSKNQMPRLLVEVIYNNSKLDGELDYIDIIKDVEDEELRNIDQVQIDLSKLSRYYDLKKDDIEKIVIYTHPSVKLLNIDDRFELKTI
ncbi:type I-B CRISPR-associated protein Cas7/Csh2 [Intestinibacter bartlettii]|uniref:type I-B CRISPR-associated protein Cas7/Csh2 n=1 Tax=Intestinibacter bartlettii TaxID=261299 RepID=UPI00319DFF89